MLCSGMSCSVMFCHALFCPVLSCSRFRRGRGGGIPRDTRGFSGQLGVWRPRYAGWMRRDSQGYSGIIGTTWDLGLGVWRPRYAGWGCGRRVCSKKSNNPNLSGGEKVLRSLGGLPLLLLLRHLSPSSLFQPACPLNSPSLLPYDLRPYDLRSPSSYPLLPPSDLPPLSYPFRILGLGSPWMDGRGWRWSIGFRRRTVPSGVLVGSGSFRFPGSLSFKRCLLISLAQNAFLSGLEPMLVSDRR